MRAEAWIFGSLTIFFALVTPAYWLITMDASGTPEITGTAALILTFFLSLMISGYFALIARRIDPRPEDKKDGEIAEGAGELGFFAPHSKWPLFVSTDLRAGCPRADLRLVAGDPGLRLRRADPLRTGVRVLPRRPRALS